jgi:hypothetical protein
MAEARGRSTVAQEEDDSALERRPIGQILIEMGVLNEEQLNEALAIQRKKAAPSARS